MLELLKAINLAVRFLLELCVLGICAYRGYAAGDRPLTAFLFGVGAPLGFAVIWGTFISPKAAFRLREPWRSLVELAIFGLATAALYSLGKAPLAAAFGAVYLVSKLLMVIWKQ